MKRDMSIAGSLLWPASIALVGASADEGKHTGLAQRFLRRHGYQGRVFPVNPRHRKIGGERAWAAIGAIGEHVDHAFILLPTAAVHEALVQCGEAGVPCVTVLANGYAESGESGHRLQQQLLATARRFGIRLLGPNSLGLVNLTDGIVLTVSEVLSLPALRAGRLGLVSQSGGMMGALLSHGQARGIGFSKLVSTGNEADLDVGEIGDLLVDDPHTDAILLFLEAIRGADRMEAMVRRAHRAGKPVVAYSTARSAIGEQLAAAHTGAIAGSGAAMAAFLRDIGVVRVDVLDTLLEIAPMLAGRSPPGGGRVSVVTTTGGGGGLVVDCLARLGVEVVPPSPGIRSALAARGVAVGESPLIDLTLAGTNAVTYGAVLGELLAGSGTRAVVAVVGASSQFRPDRAVRPILDAMAAPTAQPVAVFLTPCAEVSTGLLRDGGAAVFRSPEACADAVHAYLDWQPPRWPAGRPETAAAAMPAAAVLADAPAGLLDAGRAAALLDALDIPCTQTTLLSAAVADWTPGQLAPLRYPVVAKVASRAIAHKTEAGGVALGLRTPGQLRAAAARILRSVAAVHPDAAIDGIEVQPMEQGLLEVLLGYRHDPQVGPTITVGVGGVLTELYRDVATRLAPVDQAGALAMLEQVRGMQAICGYRELPRGDVAALARAIAALSRLALLPGRPVLEAEINPLIVRPLGQGVVAVDALVWRA